MSMKARNFIKFSIISIICKGERDKEEKMKEESYWAFVIRGTQSCYSENGLIFNER